MFSVQSVQIISEELADPSYMLKRMTAAKKASVIARAGRGML